MLQLQKMKWTKKAPNPVKKSTYWYWDPGIDEKYTVEVWPERYLDHYTGYWWPEPIEEPSLKELKEKLNKPKKRGRKKK